MVTRRRTTVEIKRDKMREASAEGLVLARPMPVLDGREGLDDAAGRV